jgi:hypothetical protein
MVKALARGFRWRMLRENGAYGTIEEIAATEKINSSYVGRLLRLTLLAPDIVEAILDGRNSRELTLANAMKPLPLHWDRQAHALQINPPRLRSSIVPPRSVVVAEGNTP